MFMAECRFGPHREQCFGIMQHRPGLKVGLPLMLCDEACCKLSTMVCTCRVCLRLAPDCKHFSSLMICGVFCRVEDAITECAGTVRENVQLRRAHRCMQALKSTHILSSRLEMQKACTACHTDKSQQLLYHAALLLSKAGTSSSSLCAGWCALLASLRPTCMPA